MNVWKKLLSSVLALTIILSVVYLPALSVDNPSQTTFQGGTVEVDGNSAKTVSVTFSLNEADTVEAIQGNLPTSLADGKIVLSELNFDKFTFGTNDYANTATGNFKWASFANRVDFAADEEVFHAVYTVAADTPVGTYPVELYIESLTTSDYGFDDETITGNIVVTEAAAGPDYQIYYELDKENNSTNDTDDDDYIEYDPDDSVVVSIYIVTKETTKLQAFDLYITNDAALTNPLVSDMYDGTRIESGAVGQASTATLQHIQAWGHDKDSNPINLNLPAGTPVKIAEITFTLSNDAV